MASAWHLPGPRAITTVTKESASNTGYQAGVSEESSSSVVTEERIEALSENLEARASCQVEKPTEAEGENICAAKEQLGSKNEGVDTKNRD